MYEIIYKHKQKMLYCPYAKKSTIFEGLKQERNTGICVLADVFCVLWNGTKTDNTAHAQKCDDVITKKV